MENKMFNITEEEQKAVAKRAEEVASAVKGSANVREALIAYATANGYSEEAAIDLIDKVGITTVDTYNASCREAYEGDVKTWIAQKMVESIEKQGLNEQEAVKYKLGVLQAIRKLNAGAVDGEEEVLTEDEKAMLESAEFTPEMMLQIDEALVSSIEDSAMPLYMTKAFESFLDSKADAESIRVVTTALWNDNHLKYCAATAMCVAHHNGEVPSIPEDTADANLVLGACQGVDVVNIETKVSTGEMAADVAYKILKVIGAVVLTLAAFALLLIGTAMLATCIVVTAFELLGTGFLGCLAAFLLSFPLFMVVSSDEAVDTIWAGVELVGKGADIAYNALKRGAKALYHYTAERIVPAVKSGLTKIKEFVLGVVSVVCQFVHSKTSAFAHA